MYVGDAIVAGLEADEGMSLSGSIALAATVAMIVSVTNDATGGQTRATGLAVLAGSSIAVIVAAFSGRFRSLARIP